MKKINIKIGLLAIVIGLSGNAFAETTTAEKIDVATDKVGNTMKETYRNAKDEICELVNGKLECIAKKVKNKVKTAADKAKTKSKEIKNEVTK